MSFLVKDFFNTDMLKDDFKFSPSGIYKMPVNDSLESYNAYIDNLPPTDKPEVFRLNDNATIYQ